MTRSVDFPIDVDAMSRLDSVTGKGRTIWYRYSLKSLPESETAREELRSNLKRGLDITACESRNFARLLEDGYTLVISYAYATPPFMVEHIVPPRVCRK